MAPGRQPRQQLRDPFFGDYQQSYHAGSCKTYGAKVSTVSAGVEVGRQLSNNNKQTVSVSTRGLGSPRLHEEIGRASPRRLGSFCFNKHMVSGSPRRLELAEFKNKLRPHRDGLCIQLVGVAPAGRLPVRLLVSTPTRVVCPSRVGSVAKQATLLPKNKCDHYSTKKHMVSGPPRRLEVAQLKSKLRSHRDGPCARDSYHCEMHSSGRPGFYLLFHAAGHSPMFVHRFCVARNSSQ